jgi:hypothetical protein
MIEVELPDGTIVEFPEGTSPEVMKKALAKYRAAKPAQSDAMKAGLADLSAMSKDPAAAVDAEQWRRSSDRSMGAALYDFVIGDPNDGVDSYGEQIGRGLNDMGKSAGAGLARGATGLVDLPTNITEMYSKGVTGGLEAAGIMSPETARMTQESMMAAIPGGGRKLTEGVSAATGGATDFRGNTRAGKFAGTIAEFLPGAAALGGINPASLLKYGVAPGAASEAAGQATEGSSWEGPARLAGALLGGIGPDLIAKGARAIVSPYGGADPERLKLASVLDDFGVPISAGQRVGNEALRRKEGLTGAGQTLNETQREAFTTAALKTAGIDAKRATPEVLEEAAKRIGAVFDDVTRGVDVTPDPNSVSKLSEAVSTYKSLAPTGNQAPLVSNIFAEVTKSFRGGNPIAAATVNTWRSGLSKLTASADAATREAAVRALETVDDMLTASLNAAGRAEDVARLATARGQWRNYLAIQKAATGAGEATAAGLLSPAQLRSAVVQQGRSSYARGQRGDLGDLARAGVGVMDSLPNSGTPAGIRAMIPGGSLSGALGAGIGSSFGPAGAAIGAIGGLALPGVAGAIRMSGPMQAYLANQMANPAVTNMTAGVGSALVPFAERNALAARP